MIEKKKVLLIVHQRHSVSGNVGALLAERGYELDMRCPCIGQELPENMDEHEAAVVFGGPMSANDCQTLDGIKLELDFIPKILDAEKPFLGICLGGQMLARVIGGEVDLHPEGRVEIGYYKICPTEAGKELFGDCQHFYQWHKEGFDVPDCVTELATGEHYPNQAFLYGKNAMGIQFHPEITLEMIHRWTSGAGHRMDRPGAQPKKAHLIGHSLFDKRIDAWTRNLFDYLGLPAVNSMVQAAE